MILQAINCYLYIYIYTHIYIYAATFCLFDQPFFNFYLFFGYFVFSGGGGLVGWGGKYVIGKLITCYNFLPNLYADGNS
jgi:hypothetical protein